MVVAKEMIRCPQCRETIAAGATRCKHCHGEIKSSRKKPSKFAGWNTFRTGFLGGILFALILAVLVYFQFWN